MNLISDRDQFLLSRYRIELVDNCKKCNGSGYNFAEQCTCIKQYDLQRDKVVARIPFAYRDFTLETFKGNTSKEMEVIRKYILKAEVKKKKGMGLLITGAHGSGKGSVGSMILGELITRII